MRIIVLGGGGAMGMVTVRDLTENPEVSEVIIGEFNKKQAQKVAEWTGSNKVTIREVNVTNHKRLVDTISDVDAVANAVSYNLNLHVTRAAMEAKKPLTDLGGVYYMTLDQLKLDKDMQKSGATAVLGCGLAPGTADILAKFGADKLDLVDEVHIRYGDVNLEPVKYKWSFRTVLEEYTKGPIVYQNGEFKQLEPFSGKHAFKFPAPINERQCCYALYSGLATLPRTIGKGVKAVDCAMSYINEDEQRINVLNEMGLTRKEPIQWNGVEISPQEFLFRCAPPPDVHVRDAAGVVVEVSGEKGGDKAKYTYSLVYKYHKRYGVSALAYLTGMPMSIVACMLAKSEVQGRGVLPPELGVKPEPFFAELAKRGVKILETVHTSREIYC